MKFKIGKWIIVIGYRTRRLDVEQGKHEVKKFTMELIIDKIRKDKQNDK